MPTLETQKDREHCVTNNKHGHWGDRLAHDVDMPDYNKSVTKKDVIGTTYAYYFTTLLSKTQPTLGKKKMFKNRMP